MTALEDSGDKGASQSVPSPPPVDWTPAPGHGRSAPISREVTMQVQWEGVAGEVAVQLARKAMLTGPKHSQTILHQLGYTYLTIVDSYNRWTCA